MNEADQKAFDKAFPRDDYEYDEYEPLYQGWIAALAHRDADVRALCEAVQKIDQFIEQGTSGDYCPCCSAVDGHHEHEPDCAFVLAAQLLEKVGGGNEQQERESR